MKRIIVDVYKARDLFTGLGQFSVNFAQALMSSADISGIKFTLLVPPGLNLEKKPGFDFIEAGFRQRYLPSLTKKYDLWHSLHQFPSHLPNKNTRQILTVHDLNFLVEKDSGKVKKYVRRLQKDVDRATAVTVISNATKDVLEKNINTGARSVTTIYNGVKLDTYLDSRQPDYISGSQYFFAIGVFKRKKNYEVLLPMMKYFPDHKLIIAGDNATSYGQSLHQLVDNLGLNSQVFFPGKVGNEEKHWLYSHCEAFLMPSLAEGFGLPVIEAMMAGRPVFLSPIASLQEVGGTLAFYFKSYDGKAMADQIGAQLTADSSQANINADRLKKYANRFHWKGCISQYLELYQNVLEN
jgi:glycosyltransferase involved in cell wall biosynthesis